VNGETRTGPVVDVLGIRFHRLARHEVVERVLHWVADKSAKMVITAGPEFIMQAQWDEQLQKIVRAADVVTADGIGVVWAARRLGSPVPERVTGVELVPEILQEAEYRHQRLRVFLLGASPMSLEKCIAELKVQFPTQVFAGHNGYFDAKDEPQIVAEIRAFQPDLWLVGLGQPRQEQLIFDWLGKLPSCVAVGVGGSIDVWGGSIERAPLVFRRFNLEWLYRLLRQPSRWRRQMALPKFAFRVLRSIKSTQE
jgi:N-acetylglucosaminyldiphosphoundecaprenol N-acetyl-beta-D-mannosaminyltransferase